MEANELRIGNYVYDVAQDQPYRIDYFDNTITSPSYKDDFFYCVISGAYPFPVSTALPVPITEEWLLKFGFEQGINGFELSLDKNGDLEYVKIGRLFNSITVTLEIAGNRTPIYDLKYVHQLQNLYFALTGEELL